MTPPPAGSQPAYLSAAIRGLGPTDPAQIEIENKRKEEERRKKELKRKTAFLNDMYGAF
jgi:hypothetical protein